MPCFKPITAYPTGRLTAKGKVEYTFNPLRGYRDRPQQMPCGRCIGCRLERSRQWAIRCINEASLYEDNCFITLTYSPEHLPEDNSVHVEHFQKFMKRLRKKFGSEIRFFHCGEYGEKTLRPHYHAIIFNLDFKDKVLWKIQNNQRYYVSEKLQKLWPFGHSIIGNVTFESAAYVARYILKKVTGDDADSHYTRVDAETGEVFKVRPEYVTMSRRPGIGKPWLEKYKNDVFPHDYCVVRGVKMKPPKYYLSQYEITDNDDFQLVKLKRLQNAIKNAKDNSLDRLQVKEILLATRLTKLVRNLD